MGMLTDYLYGPDSTEGGSGSSGGLLTRYLSNRKSSKSSGDSQGSDADGYKKGGMVKKTGLAKVHKGERVLTKAQAKKYAAKKKGGK